MPLAALERMRALPALPRHPKVTPGAAAAQSAGFAPRGAHTPRHRASACAVALLGEAPVCDSKFPEKSKASIEEVLGRKHYVTSVGPTPS